MTVDRLSNMRYRSQAAPAAFPDESDEEPEAATFPSAMFSKLERAPGGSLQSSGSAPAHVKTPATPSPLSPSSPSGAGFGGLAGDETGGHTRPALEPNEIERRLMEIRAKQKQQIFKRDSRAKEAQRKHYGHDDFGVRSCVSFTSIISYLFCSLYSSFTL